MILGFGEALVDVLPSGEVVGGAPLNFALRAAELSAPRNLEAALVTRIGADDRGESILARLAQSHLNTSAVQVDSRLPTGYVNVALIDGQPEYEIGPSVAWDEITFDANVNELSQRCATLCFGTLSQRSRTTRATLERITSVARSATKILDINIRKPVPELSVLEESLEIANVLKCNEEELLQLSDWLRLDDRTSAELIAAELQSRYELTSIFWTRGKQGCVWQNGSTLIDAAVPKMNTASDADTVGAGDSASAALAVGLTLNWSPEHIVAAANLCGAFAASVRGPSVPLPDELLHQVLEG